MTCTTAKATIGLLTAALVCLSSLAAGASEPIRLTADGVLKLSPAICGNGAAQVAYCTHEQPKLVAIWQLNLVDRTCQRLHPEVSVPEFDPAFSSDGRYRVCAQSAVGPQLFLVIEDVERHVQANFKPQDGRATARYPSITPDGQRVVFSLSDLRGHQIASVNMQGGDLKLLAASTGMNSWPSVSPDGKKIAFGSSRDGSFEIYTMDASGENVQRLTKNAAADMRPTWSPDGRRLAFTSNRDGNYEIYVMNPDGSAQANVTQNPERDDYPVWHPDGKHLLMISERDGQSDLYQVEVPAVP